MVGIGDPLGASYQILGNDGPNPDLNEAVRNAGIGVKGPMACAFGMKADVSQGIAPAEPGPAPTFQPQAPAIGGFQP